MQVETRRQRHPLGSTGSPTLVVAALSMLVAGCTGGAPESPEGASDGHQTAEVTVPVEGLELSGTLRLPDGTGPHTGIVVAHGSGPSSRRGELPGQLGLTLPAPVAVYEQLASGFRNAGYAVLTFDKRTCGPFNGCAENGYPAPPDDLTLDTFVDDLGAVVDHLGDREDIDGIAIVGHSKGGTVAAQLAARQVDLDALVLLATPAVGVPELLTNQARTLDDLITATGQSGPRTDPAVAELESMATAVASVADGELEGPPVGGVPRAFWSSWIEAAATAPTALGDSDVPVLVVGGAKDWNVLPDQLRAWSPVLAGEDDELVVLDDVTHALTHLAGDDPAAITPADVGTSVDQRVIDTVTDWLDGVTR